MELRILHVAETAQGGVGSYIEEVMLQQKLRYGDNSVRAVLPGAHAAHFKRIELSSLDCFELSSRRIWHSLAMCRLALARIDEWKPDVVHIHSSFAGLLVRPSILALSKRPRVIYCAHGWAFDRVVGAVENRVAALIERLLSYSTDKIICVSEADRVSAERAGLARRKLTLVRNGIRDISPVCADGKYWPSDCVKILFVGRLDRQKGIDILADVMRQLGDSFQALIIGSSVVGDGGVALPSNCKLLGWLSREEISSIYEEADFLLMPSRWEGLPIVAIEALRAGLPVISSAVGGLPEIVIPNVSGYLVTDNQPEAFVAAIRGISSGTLAQLGKSARLLFESEFSIGRVVDQLHDVYTNPL